MVYFIGGDEGGGFLTDFFSFTQRTLKTDQHRDICHRADQKLVTESDTFKVTILGSSAWCQVSPVPLTLGEFSVGQPC